MFRILVIAISAIFANFVFLSESVLAHPAWGIVVDRQEQVYISDLETIWKIDAHGRQSIFRAGVSGRHTHELTIDETDNLYGEDFTYESETGRNITAIWKMTPAGVFSYVLAPTSNPPKGISIWKDRDGNTYSLQWNNSSDQEVLLLKRTPDGSVGTLIGSRKSVGDFRQSVLSSIGGMTFGADGSLYLTDRASIQKVTTSGTVTTIARNITDENSSKKSPQNSNTSLSGIAVDASGNIYAADFGNRRVLKIAPDGNMQILLRAENPWSPSGVAFKNGNLYILEVGSASQRPRVRKLTSDGKSLVLATIGENSDSPAREPIVSSNTETPISRTKFPLFLIFGLCAGVFAVTFAVWRIRKKKIAGLPESKA